MYKLCLDTAEFDVAIADLAATDHDMPDWLKPEIQVLIDSGKLVSFGQQRTDHEAGAVVVPMALSPEMRAILARLRA